MSEMIVAPAASLLRSRVPLLLLVPIFVLVFAPTVRCSLARAAAAFVRFVLTAAPSPTLRATSTDASVSRY